MPASDARPVPRKNVAFRFYFSLRNVTNNQLITAWAGADSEISLDDGGFNDCTNEAVEIGTSGVGYIDFTAAEMNADCVLYKLTVTNTNSSPLVITFYPEESGDYRINQAFPTNFASMDIDSSGRTLLQPTQTGVTIPTVTTVTNGVTLAANQDVRNVSGVITDKTGYSLLATTGFGNQTGTLSTVTTTGTATAVGTVNGLAANVITAASIASSAITSAKIATDAIGAAQVASTAVTKIQDGLATPTNITSATGVTTSAFSGAAATTIGNIETQATDANNEATAAAGIASKLDTALELDGAVYRFTVNALEQAPSGGGGGSTDWNADERTAIRAILGIPGSGTTPADPSTGILDTIRDSIQTVDSQVDSIVSSVGAIETKVDTIDSNVDTLLVRITSTLFSGITSLADWIRRIARKDAGTAGMIAAEAEIDTGGTSTFTGTTDSLEAIRDAGGGSGSGGTVNITVEDRSITLG